MQAEKGRVHEGAALPLAGLLMAFHDLWNVLPEASFQVIQAPLSITYLLDSQTHSSCKVQCKCLAMATEYTAAVLVIVGLLPKSQMQLTFHKPALARQWNGMALLHGT